MVHKCIQSDFALNNSLLTKLIMQKKTEHWQLILNLQIVTWCQLTGYESKGLTILRQHGHGPRPHNTPNAQPIAKHAKRVSIAKGAQ